MFVIYNIKFSEPEKGIKTFGIFKIILTNK